MNEREQMYTQLHHIAMKYDGEEEDRACLAVAFAWAWKDFPINVDGETRAGQIQLKPMDLDDQGRFRDEFVPAVNAELAQYGFKPFANLYGSGDWFYDLNDTDRVQWPGAMALRKHLARHGVVVEENKGQYEDYRQHLVDLTRKTTGRWFKDVGHGLRI